MGHKVGWLTLYAGIAGGADVILLPEIPYDINKVVDSLYLRTGQGKRFCILAVAEGALSKKKQKCPKGIQSQSCKYVFPFCLLSRST